MKKIFVVKRTDSSIRNGDYIACTVMCDSADQAKRVNPAFNQSKAGWYKANPLLVDDYDIHSFLFYPENWTRARALWTSDQRSLKVTCTGLADPSCVEDELLSSEIFTE